MNENEAKFKELLPSFNFIFTKYLNLMKNNDMLINKEFKILKENVNKKINIHCKEYFDYLNKFGKLKDVQNDGYSLFNFEFININKGNDTDNANKFMKCVADLTADANKYIDEMSDVQAKINYSIRNCKKSCIIDKKEKIVQMEIQNEVFKCLDECLNKTFDEHNNYTEKYIKSLKYFNKNFI
jgi:hypothetical protein